MVFARGSEVKEYVDRCADHCGIRPHVRLQHEFMRRMATRGTELLLINLVVNHQKVRFIASFDHHGDTPFLRPTSGAQAWSASEGFPFEDYIFSGQ